jgi:hypothetical protein
VIAPLLLLGIALGPQGIRLLSPEVIAFVDPAVPVALGALGALLGLSAGTPRAGDRRLFAAAAVETIVTAALTGGAFVALLSFLTPAASLPPWLLPAMVAVCAVTSLAVSTGSPAAPGDDAGRVIELGALLAVIAGGVLLAAAREPSLAAVLSLALQTSLATVVLAASAWLLVSQATSDTAERVFTVAALLLVGGAADYLSLSALLGGLLAGMLWQAAGGPARERLRRDALYVQRPLLVLVLVIAGARAEITPATIGLGIGYAFLRGSGRIAGGWIAGRIAAPAAPAELGLRLLPPGVLGVAFAMNGVREYGSDISALLTVVVIGTCASDLLARLARPAEVAVG